MKGRAELSCRSFSFMQGFCVFLVIDMLSFGVDEQKSAHYYQFLSPHYQVELSYLANLTYLFDTALLTGSIHSKTHGLSLGLIHLALFTSNQLMKTLSE